MSTRHAHLWLCLLATLAPYGWAQQASQPLDGKDGRDLALDQFRPRSMLQVPMTDIARARFPVVDVHTHFGFRQRGSERQLREYVDLMDRNGVAVCVSLDAKLGGPWREHAEFLWKSFPHRFVVFAHIDWQGQAGDDELANWACQQPEFARRVAQQLREAHAAGLSGLKIFKALGLQYRNPDGSLMAIDDRRWDPIWQACGELALPVLIHTADPAAFFQPVDATNERWEELHRHPAWNFAGPEFPARDELLAARNRVIRRFPNTVFIAAHMANNPEDLRAVGQWLDQLPNLYVETASRIGELGRQPFSARDFFLRYPDRILFGTDGPWPQQRVRMYWRFLETRDEYFPYAENAFPPQGFWRIYGLQLPHEVLRKVYYQNAARIVPGVKQRLQELHPDLAL